MKKPTSAFQYAFTTIFIATLIFLGSCEKNARLTSDEQVDLTGKLSSLSASALATASTCTGIKDSVMPPNLNDSIERPTILGAQHVNPYLIPNMKQAYANLHITSQTVSVTNKYVRFLPNSAEQLANLDSIMDIQGLDLFETPMDYDVTEGDFYQDPSIPLEQVTWQYAVVPPNFVAPSGITYQELAQIHIPGDNYTAVETEAERLAALQDCSNASSSIASQQVAQPTPQIAPVTCPHCQVWSVTQNKCVPYTCPTGYVCDDEVAGGCKLIPPPPVDPPSAAVDAAIPAGKITVFDTQIPDNSHLQPVRNVRIILKRWFKIQRIYTDNNGNFAGTKRYKHKVRVIVKFRNSDASIRGMRPNRLWQMLLPIAKSIGTYSSNKNSINFPFQKDNSSANRELNRFWAGATVHNAVQEYKDYAAAEHIGRPGENMKILITSFAHHGDGSSPMFSKRNNYELPQEFAISFLSSSLATIAGGFLGLVQVLKHQVDVTISYNGADADNYNTFHSDDLKTTAYHELAHTSEYVQLGILWYNLFISSELTQIINTIGSANSPYGNGSNSLTAPIIALGESWAYHIGQYFADKRYLLLSSAAGEQGTNYNNNSIPGLSSHLIALENFDPSLTTSPFSWIPKGLYYDLIDTRIEVFPNDQVSRYTNQQLFNAFKPDITALQGYRTNLLSLNSNNQSVQVTNLFQSYGY